MCEVIVSNYSYGILKLIRSAESLLLFICSTVQFVISPFISLVIDFDRAKPKLKTFHIKKQFNVRYDLNYKITIDLKKCTSCIKILTF